MAFALITLLLFATGTLSASAAGTDDAAQEPSAEAMYGPIQQPPTGPFQPNTETDDVTFELVDVHTFFGPETYKGDDRFNTRNPDDFENQTTAWETSLGHAISFIIDVEAASGTTIDCDERFEALAYIDTGGTRLFGWTNGTVDPQGSITCQAVAGVRTFNVTFDLDGAPTSTTGALYDALPAGIHRATLELYYNERPSIQNPSGRGPLAGTYQIGFSVIAPSLDADRPVMFYPDGTLRLFADVGATNQYAMPVEPYVPGDTVRLDMGFAGAPVAHPFHLVGHYGQRVAGGGIEPPTTLPPPLAPAAGPIDKVFLTDDRSIQVFRVGFSLNNSSVPTTRALSVTFDASDFQPQSADHVPLHALTLVVPASTTNLVTGATTMVIPVETRDFPTRQIIGEEGPNNVLDATRVRFEDSAQQSGGPGGGDAGDVFALRPIGFGHATITKAALTRQADERWATGSISHVNFVGTETPVYDVVAFFYGANDEFYGLTFARRGIEVVAGAVQTVEGTSGDLVLTVASLSTDFDDEPGEADFTMPVTVMVTGFPDGSTAYANTSLTEGQRQTTTIPVPADRPGNFALTITATSGELTRTTQVAVEVISAEAAAEAARRWYDIPTSGIPVTILALLGVAALVARRPRP